MFCIRCGRENPTHATACSYCGKTFVKAAPAAGPRMQEDILAQARAGPSVTATSGENDDRREQAPHADKAGHGLRGFLRRHYHGDYSLARSFWVNNFLIASFAPLLGILTIPWMSEQFPARYAAASVVILTILGVTAWFWAMRGTWASASRHVGRGGRPFWAYAAKLAILLSVFRHIGGFAASAPLVAAHLKVAFGSQPGPSMTIQMRNDGKAVQLEGGINDGTARSLRKALDDSPSVDTIVLHSHGGWLREGRLVGKVIAERGLNTRVEQECDSACTIAFLAGKERSAAPEAKIGFHSARPITSAGDDDDMTGQEALRKVYRNAGLSARFIEKVLNIPGDRVWYPSQDELLAAGVITSKSAGSDEARLKASRKGREQLAAEFRKLAVFNSLSAKYPSEFDSIVDSTWEKVEAGASDREIVAHEKEQMARLFMRLVPSAPDNSLAAMGTLVLDELVALRKRNAAACVELLFPSGNQTDARKYLPSHLVRREMAVMNDIILTSDPENQPPDVSDEEMARIRNDMSGLIATGQIDAFASSGKRKAVSSKAICDTSIAFFSALNALPEHDRAQFLRGMYRQGGGAPS